MQSRIIYSRELIMTDHEPQRTLIERTGVSQQLETAWNVGPSMPPQLENKSWVFRHPGPVITVVLGLLMAGQWASIQYMADSPAQKKTNTSIRGIRKDMKIMQVYILESGRNNRRLLGDLAKANNLKYEESRELVQAETAVRKLLVK